MDVEITLSPDDLAACAKFSSRALVRARAMRWMHNLLGPTAGDVASDPSNGWLFAPQRLSITAQGVVVAGESHRSLHTWNIVNRIETTDEHCFLFITSTTAHIVPRRCFSDEASFLQFVQMARQFKEGSGSADIRAEPFWSLPRRSNDLFDPNSSY